jgi:AraC-like DNA-binding protein
MYQQYSTEGTPAQLHQRYWQEVIGNTYFNLQLRFGFADSFNGTLQSWDMGPFSLSRLQSDALSYERLQRHCQHEEEHFLVTIPEQSEIAFSQFGRKVACKPGGFILEHSNEPYLFEYGQTNAMWVLKLPGNALRNRIRSPDRFCAMPFEALSGIGMLFSEYLQLIIRCQGPVANGIAPLMGQQLMGQQLMELLAATLEADPRILHSTHSAVRCAHLKRVETFIRSNLSDPELTPERIADACAISIRYLHVLFKETGQTVSQWIRDLRLQAAYEHLCRSSGSTQIGQIAYQWGFADQAQFCHAFKMKFGHTPSDIRKQNLPPP